MKYFDAHSHLNFPEFDHDREAILQKMRDEGIWTITVGTDVHTSEGAVELAEKNNGIFATVGIHPTDVKDNKIEHLERLITSKKIVAIGECGLDYFRLDENSREAQMSNVKVKENQRSLFVSQIELAQKHNLPLMIHARPSRGTMDAYEDVVGILKGFSVVGNVHFFVGSIDIAKKFLDLGFTLSFDGPITFTDEYNDVIQFIPLGMLHAETDAPFASPIPYRGKRNEPLYVKKVVSAIANIKKTNEEKVRETLVINAERTFNLTNIS